MLKKSVAGTNGMLSLGLFARFSVINEEKQYDYDA